MSIAIVFPEPGVVAVAERSIPQPGPFEVVCRANRSLLSTGTESFCLAGEFDPGTFWEEWVHFPFAPGYSMASTVVAVGDSVDDLTVGDRVASTTAHAQYFAVDAAETVRIPNDVTDEQASWMSLACTTQMGVRRTRIEFGDTVAVVGLGLLGQLVVQYLRIAGAGRIICVDTSAERLELARSHGATDTILATAGAARDEIARITAGELCDVVFDITGHFAVLAEASTLLRPTGKLILLGDSPSPSRQVLGPRVVADSLTIIGVHGSSAPSAATHLDRWTEHAMTALFFELVRSGRMDVDSLVTHRFDPRDAAAVYENLRVDRSAHLGVLFDWSAVSA